MKSKIVAIVLVVMMVVGALVFASCSDDDSKNCDINCKQETKDGGTTTESCTTDSCAVVKAYESKKDAKCDC